MEEPPIRAPVLKPTSSSPVPDAPQVKIKAKSEAAPLKLTPSRNTPGLRFGATSTSSNTHTDSIVPNMKLSSESWGPSESTFEAPKPTSSNSTPNHSTTLDWSSAETSSKPTINSSILTPQNIQANSQMSNWAPMASSSGPSQSKLPPGFDTILTPNSTGSGPPPAKPSHKSDDLLDFL
ncbi:hypothetical protein JCM33374_g1621 [Metschnikowia sp. JCM 33374]|nr:hypothetical protein JCM33374_g1621 [Metschnikowia sp. JCM 33374]